MYHPHFATLSSLPPGALRPLSPPLLVTPVVLFLPRDALVHSAVLRLHVVRPSVCLSVCLSVCGVGGSGSHRLEILETNCVMNSASPNFDTAI